MAVVKRRKIWYNGRVIKKVREDHMSLNEAYTRWLERATEDEDLQKELKDIAGQEEEIRDRFYRELAFGTAGLRGVIGAGENRMNIYTVRRATQGLADYLNAHFDAPAVAISYDSRIKSDYFSREAARVLAGNGVKTYLFPQLEPTPVLSYAVRYYHCDAGIMMTASHNPAKYNGYKCYGGDGCQMTEAAANEVTDYIRKTDMFDGVKLADYASSVAAGNITLIGDELIENYLAEVEKQQVNPGICASAGLKLIYTPLNGTGNLPVRAILDRIGAKNVTVVPEQELPDGNFPTAPFPNPEIRQAFEKAIALAKTVKPDLLLATDPDADRVGIAVPRDGEYVLMTGNEVGCLLLDYILACRTENGTLPEKPVAIKSVVSSTLANAIAAHYGCEMRDILTGFKYIGEQIGLLEAAGEADRYVLGFEESYGYLAGTYVRDKDAVVASMLITEMAAYYRAKGKSLLDRMEELYAAYGTYRHSQINIYFEGEAGMNAMKNLMSRLRTDPPAAIGGRRVVAMGDYIAGKTTDLLTGKAVPIALPKTNMLVFTLEGNAQVIFRPSGTEPKVKGYITAIHRDPAQAAALEKALLKEAEAIVRS